MSRDRAGSDSDSDSYGSSRRELLAAAAAGSVSLVAGCSGGSTQGSNQQGSNQVEGEKSRVDRKIRTRIKHGVPPSRLEFNWWNNSYKSELAKDTSAIPGRYSVTAQKWLPLAAEGWTLENNKFKITLKEGLQWSDGKSVTGEDFAIFHEMRKRMVPEDARPESPLATGYDHDGRTFIAKLNDKGVNKGIVLNEFLNKELPPNVRRGSWMAKQLKKLQDTSDSKAKSDIRRKVTKKSYKLPDPVFSGPYVSEKVNKRNATFSTNTDDVRGKKLNWKGLKIRFLGSQVSHSVAIGSDKIDVINEVVPPSVEKPENLNNPLAPELGGIAFTINYGKGAGADPAHPILKKTPAHQALAYVFDRKEIATNAMKGIQEPSDVPSGLLDSIAKEKFPDLYPKLNKYERNEENLGKARELMRQAGAKKKDGTWVDQKGDPIKIPVQVPPWSEWAKGGQTMVKQLQNFGFKATLLSKSGSTFSSNFWGSKDYVAATGTWGGGPFVGLAYQSHYDPAAPIQPPETFEAPKEVGNWDSELKEWNTWDLYSQLRTMDYEESLDVVRKLMWVYNYAQPAIQIMRDTSGAQVNTKHFEWPTMPPKNDQGFRVSKPDGKGSDIWGINKANEVVIKGHGGVSAKKD